MKVSELLTEETWTKKYYAADTAGNMVSNLDSSEAVKWCLVGAISKCYPEWSDREKAFAAVSEIIGNNHYVSFNDNAIWPQMKELIEKAGI